MAGHVTVATTETTEMLTIKELILLLDLRSLNYEVT